MDSSRRRKPRRALDEQLACRKTPTDFTRLEIVSLPATILRESRSSCPTQLPPQSPHPQRPRPRPRTMLVSPATPSLCTMISPIAMHRRPHQVDLRGLGECRARCMR